MKESEEFEVSVVAIDWDYVVIKKKKERSNKMLTKEKDTTNKNGTDGGYGSMGGYYY